MFALAGLVDATLNSADAQNCRDQGGLRYLGNSTDSSQSIWLSGTVAGDFELEAAQGSQVVDDWSQARKGLHVSRSPVVSSGNGGTHRLFSTGGNKPCLIDTQNQRGGIALPPNVTLPGIVLPPIGSLFPDFQLPSLPGGGATPPIARLPSRPGAGVTPPIATRPPSGVTPGVPSRPPSGVVPPVGTLPSRPGGGVTPPIGTLPPGGGGPTDPGGVVPPVGSRPVTPVQPPDPSQPHGPGGYPRPVSPTQNEGMAAEQAGVPEDPCFDAVDERLSDEALEERRRRCVPALLQGPPLTPGRDLTPVSLWNAWSDAKLIGVSDRRFGLDMESLLGSAAIGLDRRVTENLILGMTLSFDQGRTTGYDGSMEVDTQGVSVGPYVAFRLSQHWAADASLSVGLSDSDLSLSVLDGSYRTRQATATVDLYGQYMVHGFFVRPKLTATYSYIDTETYDLAGTVRGRPVAVEIPGDSFGYGVATVSAEVSRLFVLPDGNAIMPFAEIGIDYEYERPNDGAILTGDLALATPSPWAGSLEVGARMLFSNVVQVETSGAYRSFGQANLDIWEGHLNVSIAF
ncbi:autotransporter outer membrane beta-barrel domain-containing protein [Amorphus orientalis]|uniref:Autotransporter domain-containing protein n=1 Tax=Amorphus orientalis TaxID=649198 RepID=A0AAE3VSQ0_9HYPH|nr:autotransporter outer membrane beta-barrel domain-containing protein [Amorphus orientalis]MDQ0317431.1 hypothetical protein [Amorphus orientalis]